MKEIAYLGACPSCGGALSEKRSVQASLLDTGGWEPVKHHILRCRNRSCVNRNRSVGYNYINAGDEKVAALNFLWDVDDEMAFFFVHPSWGVTVSWLRQFSRRACWQWASFKSEAQVHSRTADKTVVPSRSDLKLQRSWCLWRVVPGSKYSNFVFLQA